MIARNMLTSMYCIITRRVVFEFSSFRGSSKLKTLLCSQFKSPENFEHTYVCSHFASDLNISDNTIFFYTQFKHNNHSQRLKWQGLLIKNRKQILTFSMNLSDWMLHPVRISDRQEVSFLYYSMIEDNIYISENDNQLSYYQKFTVVTC